MTRRAVQLLLVEDDADLVEMITRCLQDMMRVCVTHVSSAADAMREELTARHDVVVVSTSLPHGLSFASELRVTNRCPIILLADHPTVDEAIEAIRLGVTDLLVKPFDIADMVAVVQKAAERERKRRRNRIRYRRLRRMASRIVCERRDLRQRMDLICQDLVHAYRGLAQKVAESGMLMREPLEQPKK